MRKIVIVALLVTANSANAGQIKTTHCRSEISDCYGAMEAACGGNFRIIDRSQYYADILFRELPGRSVYNEYLFQCGVSR
jgi:hypothetical protein